MGWGEGMAERSEMMSRGKGREVEGKGGGGGGTPKQQRFIKDAMH